MAQPNLNANYDYDYGYDAAYRSDLRDHVKKVADMVAGMGAKPNNIGPVVELVVTEYCPYRSCVVSDAKSVMRVLIATDRVRLELSKECSAYYSDVDIAAMVRLHNCNVKEAMKALYENPFRD